MLTREGRDHCNDHGLDGQIDQRRDDEARGDENDAGEEEDDEQEADGDHDDDDDDDHVKIDREYEIVHHSGFTTTRHPAGH